MLFRNSGLDSSTAHPIFLTSSFAALMSCSDIAVHGARGQERHHEQQSFQLRKRTVAEILDTVIKYHVV